MTTAARPRPVPALRHHTRVGQAYARWKVRGRRFVRYFGTWGPADDCRSATYARYAAWAATWPAVLAAARGS